jgi:hypothetical protein
MNKVISKFTFWSSHFSDKIQWYAHFQGLGRTALNEEKIEHHSKSDGR